MKSHKIAVHDYAGHTFQVQLSRWLAARGHQVLHLYSADVETPRGRLSPAATDPAGFTVESVTTGRRLDKYALVRRWLQERAYARVLAERIEAFAPDVVLSANAPPAVQARLAARLRTRRIPLVCWVQDIFTLGAAKLAESWPPPLRRAALWALGRVEFGTMRRAAGLVAISPDFLSILARHGVRHPAATVIENWAPADEIRPDTKDNDWARRHGLADCFCFLYSGTLGMKHNPGHLAELARTFRDDPATKVVVVSQGLGRRWLEEVKAAEGLDRLILLDFQPFESLPQVLASADVTVVLLEEFAGVLSVPSKVYSSFCARRPLLAAMPASNRAARLIEETGAGLCVPPQDGAAFVAAARRLRLDAALRHQMAARQADHAATAFDIELIGRRFLDVLDAAVTAG